MQFEWDEEKSKINIQKHNISFVAAIDVFYDPNRLEQDSTREEHAEARTKTIGKVKGELIVTVISTDREQRVRIISARRARKNEKERYYNG